jgi:NAD-dependent dihydropyrimidine dehydrogenase PreA subunit
MARPLWLVELIKKSFPRRFTVARLTKAPVIGAMLERWLFAGDDLICLPRDRAISVNEPIQSPARTVLPSQVVEHFIERAAHHWIMNSCICREGGHCKEYPHNLGCLFLGEATLGINPGLGRRVSKEEAHAHVRRCREAGLVHLIGRNKLDAVWLGIGPGERLLTICNCCPCCCLWRVLPHIATTISERVTRMPGVTVNVSERCQACGTCTQGTCFVDAISLGDDRAVISDACRGCGRCVAVCPNAAIDISIDLDRWIEPTIQRISTLVDLS